MSEDSLNASDPETADHHWFPFLRYKKECEEAGKEVSVNAWMRETGQLDEKIAHEESVALASKIAAEKEANAVKEIEKEALKKKKEIESQSKVKTKLQ
tara:strand:- start:85 stop:378 length:294 start_codon:yes stop_codon:yes gene_type:complete